jgi:hypothetical protein
MRPVSADNREQEPKHATRLCLTARVTSPGDKEQRTTPPHSALAQIHLGAVRREVVWLARDSHLVTWFLGVWLERNPRPVTVTETTSPSTTTKSVRASIVTERTVASAPQEGLPTETSKTTIRTLQRKKPQSRRLRRPPRRRLPRLPNLSLSPWPWSVSESPLLWLARSLAESRLSRRQGWKWASSPPLQAFNRRLPVRSRSTSLIRIRRR